MEIDTRHSCNGSIQVSVHNCKISENVERFKIIKYNTSINRLMIEYNFKANYSAGLFQGLITIYFV